MRAVVEQEKPDLKVFLSHRYKSPEVNLTFFELLSEHAKVQFEVDEGNMPTNVTRLERMIRNSNAFLGLYPFPKDPNERVDRAQLLAASRYFRLELDIAVRARKPILVFFDQRYSDVLNLPESALSIPFDIQEVTGRGGMPHISLYRRAVADFFRFVEARILAEAERRLTSPSVSIGLIVPVGGHESAGYSEDHIEAIKQVVDDQQFPTLHTIPEPLILDGRIYRWLESLDWAIVDVGEAEMKTGIIGYLHATLIPMVRLYKGFDSVTQVQQNASYRGLFGGVDVGYRKDIVFWNSETTLKRELANRLETLRAPPRLISGWESAEEYFRSAALRNEAVFVSYSGRDQEIARQISGLLKRRFQEVFDYRDGSSITPGQPWLKEIFDKLAKSPLGVQLISSDYLASGNCMHEAQEMVAQQDAGRMILVQIKLKDELKDLPPWMQNRQYLRYWKIEDAESVVQKLVESFDRGLNQ